MSKMFVMTMFILCMHKTGINAAEQTVVKNLDVGRYMGRWYQMASFPTIFQPERYVNTRATYTLNPNGTITVVNESWDNGKRVSIQDIAYKADPDSDEAKLKVRFPGIPVAGYYRFCSLMPNIALVGHPSRNYLWILSRKPQLDSKMYSELVEMAKAQGYDVGRLHLTPQSLCELKGL